MTKYTLRVALSIILLLGVLAVPAFAVDRCDNCRMKAGADSMYRVDVIFKDGTSKIECGLFCASMEKERAPEAVDKLVVRDYLSGEKLEAKDAVWVVGSDVRPMMSDESRVAFRDKATAEEFVASHGGRIATFDEAYEGTLKEWKGR